MKVCTFVFRGDIQAGMRNTFLNAMLSWALFALAASAGERWNNPPKRTQPDIEHGTFRSDILKTDVGYNICLPPEYSANNRQSFPVIYYLHGYEGNESSYLEYANYWREAIKRFGPVILVFVNGGETSFFSDSANGAVPGETIVVKELVPHIDRKYRSVASREGRSLHGYSMGGFGALKLAFKYPELFGSAVAFAPTLADVAELKKHAGKVYAQMFDSNAERFAENDPFVLAERNAPKIRGQVAISIIVGAKDDFLARNRALHQKLEQLHIAHTYEEIRGAGHKKDDLYEPAALGAFEFSSKHLRASRQPGSLDKR